MRLRYLFALLAVTSFIATPAWTFEPAGYQSASFAAWEATVRDSEGFPERAKNFLYDADFPKLASQVEYTGKLRKITEAKLQFISYFATTVAQKPELGARYRDEIEVREQGKLYWVCVQKADWPAQARRLKIGARFTLYHRFAGVAKGLVFVYLAMDLKP